MTLIVPHPGPGTGGANSSGGTFPGTGRALARLSSCYRSQETRPMPNVATGRDRPDGIGHGAGDGRLERQTPVPPRRRRDVHSYAKPDVAVVRHVSLDLTVDFAREGPGRERPSSPSSGSASRHASRLDTRDLTIERSRSVPTADRFERPSATLQPGRPDPGRGSTIVVPDGDAIRPDHLPDVARRQRLAVARPRADGGQEAPVPVHAVGGDPRPVAGSPSRTRPASA